VESKLLTTYSLPQNGRSCNSSLSSFSNSLCNRLAECAV
jgi:hypothetical protein